VLTFSGEFDKTNEYRCHQNDIIVFYNSSFFKNIKNKLHYLFVLVKVIQNKPLEPESAKGNEKHTGSDQRKEKLYIISKIGIPRLFLSRSRLTSV
jgi:hypothetical protein